MQTAMSVSLAQPGPRLPDALAVPAVAPRALGPLEPDRALARPPAIYAFADAELDEARFELRRQGRRVHVQPKVLRLLIYLVRHRDRVISADDLLATLWRGETVCRGSLKRAVRGARSALGDDGGRQARIRTVRTCGYQFVAPVVVDHAARPLAQATAAQLECRGSAHPMSVAPSHGVPFAAHREALCD